ncbi:MAG: hypothetical protein IJ224_02345 [Lachnospiraceae bacterium]|nr:hypothetical protein [Lachnospiraceae bacterium]
MSVLQEKAINMIGNLSDDNVNFLIEIIQRLMPYDDTEKDRFDKEKGVEAFQRLLVASDEIIKYLPDDFNPDKELEEARKEKYGM